MVSAQICVSLVDDERQVLKAVGRLLRSTGVEVQCFASGPEFIASLVGSWPDCVLLDIQMPGMTGFDVQSRLHASGIRLPVIFITAFDDADMTQSLEQAGAAGLLCKPFTEDELLQAIGLAVGNKVSLPEKQ